MILFRNCGNKEHFIELRILNKPVFSILTMNLHHISPPSLLPPIPPPCSHRQAEAAATLGAPEFTKGLLYSTCGVETLSQQQDTIEEEK